MVTLFSWTSPRLFRCAKCFLNVIELDVLAKKKRSNCAWCKRRTPCSVQPFFTQVFKEIAKKSLSIPFFKTKEKEKGAIPFFRLSEQLTEERDKVTDSWWIQVHVRARNRMPTAALHLHVRCGSRRMQLPPAGGTRNLHAKWSDQPSSCTIFSGPARTHRCRAAGPFSDWAFSARYPTRSRLVCSVASRAQLVGCGVSLVPRRVRAHGGTGCLLAMVLQ